VIKKAVKIPYLSDGSIPCYAEEGRSCYTGEGVWEEPTWVEAGDFYAILRVESVSYGRASAHVIWIDDISGATYTMSGLVFNGLLAKASWCAPFMIDGRWRPYKKGQAYFIKPVYPEDLK